MPRHYREILAAMNQLAAFFGHAAGIALDVPVILLAIAPGFLCRRLWQVPLAGFASAIAYTTFLFIHNADYWQRIGANPEFFSIAAPATLTASIYALIAFAAKRLLGEKLRNNP